MTARAVTALVITIEGGDEDFRGNDVYLGGALIAHRAYDGSGHQAISEEIAQALAALLRPELTRLAVAWARREDSEWEDR